MFWNQGNCATRRCTIERSGQAAAKARMYFRFRGEKPRISRVGVAQVLREPVDHPRPPTQLGLAVEDCLSEIPVEQDHRRVRGGDDAKALALDAGLQTRQESQVAIGQVRPRGSDWDCCALSGASQHPARKRPRARSHFFLCAERRRTAPTPPADCRFIVSPSLRPMHRPANSSSRPSRCRPPKRLATLASKSPSIACADASSMITGRLRTPDLPHRHPGIPMDAASVSHGTDMVLMICSRIEARETAGDRDILHAAAD